MLTSILCLTYMLLMGFHSFSWAFAGRKRYVHNAYKQFLALGIEVLLVVNLLICGMIKDGVVPWQWIGFSAFLLLVSLVGIMNLWVKE